jgi:hypothetical protein
MSPRVLVAIVIGFVRQTRIKAIVSRHVGSVCA